MKKKQFKNFVVVYIKENNNKSRKRALMPAQISYRLNGFYIFCWFDEHEILVNFAKRQDDWPNRFRWGI